MRSGCLSVCPSVVGISHDAMLSVLSGGIWMKLGTTIFITRVGVAERFSRFTDQ